MKFTLSVDSLTSWDSNYEDDYEKRSEVPEYIKKLASQGKWNSFLVTGPPQLRELSLDFNMIFTAVTLFKLDFFLVFFLPAELADYDIGRVLGAGSFGQVVAPTRKVDNLPVS